MSLPSWRTDLVYATIPHIFIFLLQPEIDCQMFRTKSLNSAQMTSLIEKSHPSSRVSKENHHASLRSLIADKTLQYHRHMERLVLRDANYPFSSKKKNNSSHKTHKDESPNEKPFVEQFTPCEITINEVSSSETSKSSVQPSWYDPTALITSPSAFQTEPNQSSEYSRVDTSLQGEALRQKIIEASQRIQALALENKVLAQKVNELCCQVESSELVKIQKQSESESLKLNVKMLELKLERYQEEQQIKKQRIGLFSSCRLATYSYAPAEKVSNCSQTQLEASQIDSMLETNIHLTQEKDDAFRRLDQAAQYLLKNTTITETNQIGQVSCEGLFDPKDLIQMIERQQAAQSQYWQQQLKIALQQSHNIQEQMKEENNRIKNQSEEEKIKMKEESEKVRCALEARVKQLYELLGMAQKEIKQLLGKLREQKQASVRSFIEHQGEGR